MDARMQQRLATDAAMHRRAPWWWRAWQQFVWRMDYARCVFGGGPSKGELWLIDQLKRNRAERRAQASVVRKLDRKRARG